MGKAASGVVEYPFTLLARGATAAGEKTAEVTGSPAAGALVSTALQAAPGAIVPGARALRRAGPAAAAEELSATGAPRQPPAEVGAGADVPRGTPTQPQTAPEAPGAAQAPGAPQDTAPTPNEARAQAYARNIGLDWSRLGAGTRKALTTIAQDSTALERLDPAALRRQAHLQAQRVPVPATKGQLPLDPVQLRREAVTAATTEGAPIRETYAGANENVQANLEVLRGRVAGRRGGYEPAVDAEGNDIAGKVRSPTKAPTKVGESVQGVVREKAKWSQKGYNALYKLARKTEPTARAGLKPVTDLLTENPDIQHLGWVQSWLNKARSTLPRDAEGNLPELKDVTLNELDDLRQLANKNIAAGGTAGHYASQLKKAIDTAMQDVPEGAAAWKRATDAFRKHQEEFKDQGLIRQLGTQKKGGADRALALEKTWKTVASGTVEQIKQLKTTMLKGENPALRIKGAKAWADLRGETVNRILEDARNVSTVDEAERAVLTEAALRRSITRIPRENLEEILGKGAVKELYGILRAKRLTKRPPTESGTVPNALVMAEKVLKHVPFAKYAVGAARGLHKVGQIGEGARQATAATVSPLEQAVRDVERASRGRANRAAMETLERGGPTLPAGGAPPQPLPIGEALKRPGAP